MTSSNLAALIGSRICHDLSSPLGAIANGLELIELAGNDTTSPEMSLITQSCAQANAKLRYFRLAFGLSHEKQLIGPSEANDLLQHVLKETRFDAEWVIDQPLTRLETQFTFLGVQCFENILPYGGNIVISGSPGEVVLSAQPIDSSCNSELWHALCAQELGPDIPASLVHMPYLLQLIEASNYKMTCKNHDRDLTMQIHRL